MANVRGDFMNLIITSEQRVGSRWMHYLFADLLGKGVSPEIDGRRFYDGSINSVLGIVKEHLKAGRIPKFHGVGAIALDRFLKAYDLKDYGILGVVRNPYDRTVSLAFHNRYHHTYQEFPQKKVKTDEEAVKVTALEDRAFLHSHTRQVSDLMLPFYSTFSNFYPSTNFNYVWTTYEWLKKDTAGEIQTVLRTLFKGQGIPRQQLIQDYVDVHSFKNRSGRKAGQEKRDDLWRRKGVVGDHVHWFDDECYEALKPYQNVYNGIVNREYTGKTGEIPYI